MSSNPCQVCGSTDMNLVDGYYYCVECGTQDANVRETVVEQSMLADGTFGQVLTKKKFSTVLKDAVKMSGEWHKWHAYNFILAGLTEELIALGAKPSVKDVILWIWIRYIQKFQVKEDKDVRSTQLDEECANDKNGAREEAEENILDSDELFSQAINDSKNKKKKKRKSRKKERITKVRCLDIEIITKGTLLTILYVALNLDRSDIQLTHLIRFIREGRLSVYKCLKFVPKELSVKSIPYWGNFIRCQNEYSPRLIRTYAMTVFKSLDLGLPFVPDLSKIICNYVKELCLPNDFKDLTLALMDFLPCDFLQLNVKDMQRFLRLPDYESVCMSYILVALKMCFGLDCDYELRLSDCIDSINTEQDYLKYYRLGMYSEPTKRLFSFREWHTFLQFRKMILCKYYLPMSRQYNLPADDCVFMEHLEERSKRKIKLSDDVTMDILKKIPLDDIVVISKTKFPPTLTPMILYTEVILEHVKDPELKLRLCEDFSQYSLKYATQDLKLPNGLYDEELIQGVTKENKIINPFVAGTVEYKSADSKIVLVRNCENKNWLKTKPPTAKHISMSDKNKSCSDKESDNGYDSSMEPTLQENKETAAAAINEDPEKEIKIQDIEEEHVDVSIFDDDFKDLHIMEDDTKDASQYEVPNTTSDFQHATCFNIYDSKIDIHDSFSEMASTSDLENNFDPKTFDRNKIIQELVEIACHKYKITKPRVNQVKSTGQKRKNNDNKSNQNVKSVKRIRLVQESGKTVGQVINGLIEVYYENLQGDMLTNISEQVQSAIEVVESQGDQATLNVDMTHTDIRDINFENHLSMNHNSTNENNDRIIIESVQDDTLNRLTDDDSDNDILQPTTDPNFDEKTHDIKQLYVKINEEELQKISNIEPDPVVFEIIDHQIKEFVTGNRKVSKDTERITTLVTSSDPEDNVPLSELVASSVSEDDVPLSELLYEKMSRAKRKKRKTFEKLVKNQHIKQFAYWMKHYKKLGLYKVATMDQKFQIELVENFPISFVFILRECAAISNCSPFLLYKYMETLESNLSHYLSDT